MLILFDVFENINIRKRYYTYWYLFDPLEQFNTFLHQSRIYKMTWVSVQEMLLSIWSTIYNALSFSGYFILILLLSTFLYLMVGFYFSSIIIFIRLFNIKVDIVARYEKATIKLRLFRFSPYIEKNLQLLLVAIENVIKTHINTQWDIQYIPPYIFWFIYILWRSPIANMIYWQIRFLSLFEPSISYLLDLFVLWLIVFSISLSILIDIYLAIDNSWLNYKTHEQQKKRLLCIFKVLLLLYALIVLLYIYWYMHVTSFILIWIQTNW